MRWVVLVALVGCAGTPTSGGPLSEADYPGSLFEVPAWGADFMWRQRLTARWKDGERSFDAVLQKRGGKLQLIGLSPLGQPGFVVTLENGRVAFETRIERTLPFPPRFMLLDAQRAFGPWFEAPGEDGDRVRTVDTEAVTETWHGGALRRRTFARPSKTGTIAVEYADWTPGRLPPKTRLSNGWFGYVLEIETYE